MNNLKLMLMFFVGLETGYMYGSNETNKQFRPNEPFEAIYSESYEQDGTRCKRPDFTQPLITAGVNVNIQDKNGNIGADIDSYLNSVKNLVNLENSGLQAIGTSNLEALNRRDDEIDSEFRARERARALKQAEQAYANDPKFRERQRARKRELEARDEFRKRKASENIDILKI